ncbi:MFS transporter [Corticibacter populi]|uniref:MFS transporter n=1 Tax=Corticibacter populi TaxID=1550736 RepID=A0A3M6QQI5_9BURK|nr:MFS transporter [Corticibacter populi]RMX04809.1 MFS transporter [Corticibacter populi]RZS33777.1 putative MFS family arabinose efflux permease [Corticibacter populi]
MTADERRSSLALASIFALRMLGLFLVLPVFSLAASGYRGGDDPALIGLAMGIYGLTQALLQLPLGMASDRLGRKRVIVFGLLVFAAGSGLAALSDSVWGLVIGRAVQGAGAVSAAVTALLADLTRDQVRTKAMALVGISIGMTFSLALVLGPYLGARIGLAGLFWLTAALALAGIAVVLWLVPVEPPRSEAAAATGAVPAAPWWQTPGMLRLDLGVFILHTVQMAMWSAVPALLVAAGLAREAHWQLYLPAVLASVLFLGVVFALERRGHFTLAMRAGIGLILLVQLALACVSYVSSHASHALPPLWGLGVLLFIFFCGFNALEAMQPSQVSRLSGPAARGAALGAYNTLQSLGLFAGGAIGGLLVKAWGPVGLFAVTAVLALLWLLVALGGRPVGRAAEPGAAPGQPGC